MLRTETHPKIQRQFFAIVPNLLGTEETIDPSAAGERLQPRQWVGIGTQPAAEGTRRSHHGVGE